MDTTTDHFRLFTFDLIDGRKVTYAGLSEKQAFNKARRYHLDAVDAFSGRPALACGCASKSACGAREGGWLVCGRSECAGRIG
jgi:hypothetical protein